jgi:hypothetical protein
MRTRLRDWTPVSPLRALDADVERALEEINVPAYLIDKHGIIRWVTLQLGASSVTSAGGRQFTSVCAPEEKLAEAAGWPRRAAPLANPARDQAASPRKGRNLPARAVPI